MTTATHYLNNPAWPVARWIFRVAPTGATVKLVDDGWTRRVLELTVQQAREHYRMLVGRGWQRW